MLGGFAVLGVLFGAPAGASAAVNCSFAGATLSIAVTNGSPFVTVARGTGAQAGDILVSEPGGPVPCGSPTVTTTDTISFDESGSNQASAFNISLQNGPFAPGLTDEAGASDEIEFVLDADATGVDLFDVTGGPADENLRYGDLGGGDLGANLNGDETNGVDVDAVASGFDRIFTDARAGADTVTADGTGGLFTGAVPVGVSLVGGNDDDTVRGGNGSNNLVEGDAGDDVLAGGTGGDDIRPGAGDDVADGGGASDTVSYANHLLAVTVDLRISGPQNTVGAGTDTLSNLENAVGGNLSDTLIGTDGNNTLVGGQLNNDAGADTLIGLGGADLLSGAAGDDTLVPGGGNDTMIGAAGSDTVSYASGASGPVVLSLDPLLTGVPQVTGGAGNDTLGDDPLTPGTNHLVENLIGSPFGGDMLTGNGVANVITGYGDGLGDTIDCVAVGDGDTAVLDEVGVDAAANCETVDTAPQTLIANGPANGETTNDATPTYELMADEQSNFQFRIDGGGFQACAASCTVSGLSDGVQKLAFRAVDVDETQNPDPTPATRTLTVDTTAPTVSITSSPPDLSDSANPSWTFTSNEASATFECRIDGGGFGPCSGAGTHSVTVADGEHSLDVRATDSVSNIGGPASDTFRVDTRDPKTKITKAPPRRTQKRKIKVKFTSDEPGSSFDCRLDRKKAKRCSSPYRFRAKPGRHKLLVTASDAAGNADPTPAKVRFKVEP
jgi:Ca2+-binding RTX toxin-like protein